MFKFLRKEVVMDRQVCKATAISVLLGGIVGAGAGLLLSKFGRRRGGDVLSRIGPDRIPASEEPYCSVPEGADICYPETAK
jgi:hypothetical protein